MAKHLTTRAHVTLPVELVADIDALVERRHQQADLGQVIGAWKDEDHPELAQGAASWVRASRAEFETRFHQIEDFSTPP